MKSEAIYTNEPAGKTLVRIYKEDHIEWAVCKDYDENKPEGEKWSSAKYFLDDFEGAVKEVTTNSKTYEKEKPQSKGYNIYFKEGEDYHEVTDEEMLKFIDSWEEFKNGKKENEPNQICLIARNKTDDYPWTAIDNRTNDCWTEAFKTREEAIYWLQDEDYDPYEEK